MGNGPLLIFSDSNALIGDIEYVFRNRLDFVSSESLEWVKDFLHHHDVKLLIADLDMKAAVQAEVLNTLREFGGTGMSFLFLVSEQKMLDLEDCIAKINKFNISSGWLMKPFSRNSLVSSVDRLCGNPPLSA